MESYLASGAFDLTTPDGRITKIEKVSDYSSLFDIRIEGISSAFVGFQIEPDLVFFNVKSTLAQLGLNGTAIECTLDAKKECAEVRVEMRAVDPIGKALLQLLPVGAFVGKLFAADERRKVRDPNYLSRMFHRSDRWGAPLLSLGSLQGTEQLILDKIDGRTVAFLGLLEGVTEYTDEIYNLLPTIAKGLLADLSVRGLLKLHQKQLEKPRVVEEGRVLLVRTLPLHVRTAFARVIDDFLPKGVRHTSASILEPNTIGSGDIYELYGQSSKELVDIPLEFYTLEPHREHVFFSDRDQLQSLIEHPQTLFDAFDSAPDEEYHSAVFVVKGEQLLNLKEKDWISRKPLQHEFPGLLHEERQAAMVTRYLVQQPSFPFLSAIEEGSISSQGILLTRYLPSPMEKRMLLGHQMQRQLKGIYFLRPSYSTEDYFSQEDRWLLSDLSKFAIPVYWVDRSTSRILKFVQKPNRDSGMFVPLSHVSDFYEATFLGVYGSNLLEGDFETELTQLLSGLLSMKQNLTHPLLNSKKPLALVTGGGPGVMEMGNRVAQELGILSCANVVDFRKKDGSVVREQEQNPHIEAKMTYPLDQLVKRQSEFHLDLPIFLPGGIGTDFELGLEEVERKVGSTPPTPALLMAPPEYWREKITSRFQINKKHGTIKGSEWVSNCFYCVQTAEQGLRVYRQFFEGSLPIGPNHPPFEEGFGIVSDVHASIL
jgi:predicted Rossmann-fold nucleotide-binding protein